MTRPPILSINQSTFPLCTFINADFVFVNLLSDAYVCFFYLLSYIYFIYRLANTYLVHYNINYVFCRSRCRSVYRYLFHFSVIYYCSFTRLFILLVYCVFLISHKVLNTCTYLLYTIQNLLDHMLVCVIIFATEY